MRPNPGAHSVRLEAEDDLDPAYVDFFGVMLPRAVAAARRITGDLAAAEDAASEALARAYLRWPKIGALGHRDAWVLRVATNEAIGAVRKQARRERILRRQPPPSLASEERDGTRSLLVGQIRSLPTRQREVVTLRFFADLTTEEVASALGISAGSVKSHLHRALQTLRKRLGPDILEGVNP